MRAANQDFVAGVVFATVGVFGLWVGRELNVGTAADMAEGYFPLFICKILIVLGALVAVVGLIAPGAPLEGMRWRPLAMVTFAVLAFAAALESLGVIIAVLAAVVVSNFAGAAARARSVALLAVVLSLAVLAIFIWGLGLPLRALPKGLL